jgi:predicted nucleotidyltransferase
MTATQIIDDVAQRLIQEFNPLKIILFGSRARGDFRADSDLDLLVVMPDGTDRHAAAVAMRRRLADLLTPVDVIVTTPQEIERRGNAFGSVLRPALRQGRVIHDGI